MTIDYSPAAIERRLRQASELRDLCRALAGPRLKWDWRRTSPDAPPVVREAESEYKVHRQRKKD